MLRILPSSFINELSSKNTDTSAPMQEESSIIILLHCLTLRVVDKRLVSAPAVQPPKLHQNLGIKLRISISSIFFSFLLFQEYKIM